MKTKGLNECAPSLARALRAAAWFNFVPDEIVWLTVFFDYPPQIRRAIYTTNAIESLNYSLRKVLKNRGAFPTDEAIFKVLYLALNNVTKKWTQSIQDWKAALNQFVILFGERMPN